MFFLFIASCRSTAKAWEILQNVYRYNKNDCELACNNLEDCMSKREHCIFESCSCEEHCKVVCMEHCETLFMEESCVEDSCVVPDFVDEQNEQFIIEETYVEECLIEETHVEECLKEKAQSHFVEACLMEEAYDQKVVEDSYHESKKEECLIKEAHGLETSLMEENVEDANCWENYDACFNKTNPEIVNNEAIFFMEECWLAYVEDRSLGMDD